MVCHSILEKLMMAGDQDPGMSHISCGHISAWALTAFLGSEFIWAVGYLELILLLKHTSSFRGVPAISAPHLPSLSISLPFIFKEHLPAFVWTFFFQQANPHHYPNIQKGRLTNSELDMIKHICVCRYVPRLQALLS